MPDSVKLPQITVLHVIEDLHSGGAERVVIDLASHVNRTQFRPLVCCLRKKGSMAAELETQQIPVFALDKRRKIDLGLLWRLRHLLRTEKVEVVHTHVFTANLWGRLAALLAGVPVIITHEHSSFTVDRRVFRGLERILTRWTDCTVAVSQQLAGRLMRECRVRCERLRTIYNGLNLPAQKPDSTRARTLCAELGLQKFEQIIGSVGRLDARKNYCLLIEAFARLRKRFPNAGLVLVGAGAEAAALKKKAAALGIVGSVVFAGHRTEIAELLSLFTLFCLPSQTEGISIALLEAIAAGVPVVATRVGGTPEIISDASMGTLVPPGDVDALLTALADTLENVDAAREKARKAQQQIGTNFTLQKTVRQVEKLYRDVLMEKHNGRYFFDVPPSRRRKTEDRFR